MFNLLSKGLRKKGKGGSNRLLGDVEQSVRTSALRTPSGCQLFRALPSFHLRLGQKSGAGV